MSGLSAFLKQNAVQVENIKYVASPRFQDSDGKPIPWEIKCITSAEDESLRSSCVKQVPTPGKRGQYMQETDINKYLGRLAAACTVFPELKDKELQDSYHVVGEDNLIKAMLNAGEYADYMAKIQEVCGFDRSLQDDVDEAKN